MKKGKSRMRARGDILKANERSMGRRIRRYDKQEYDKPAGEES
jgi:hypothetical protein